MQGILVQIAVAGLGANRGTTPGALRLRADALVQLRPEGIVRPRPLMCDSVRMVKEYLTTIAIMSILCDSARMCDSARSCATSPPADEYA